jgi:hypothetical protein
MQPKTTKTERFRIRLEKKQKEIGIAVETAL